MPVEIVRSAFACRKATKNTLKREQRTQITPELREGSSDHWSLLTDYCLLITDHWLLLTDYWSLVTDYWLLITGYWLLLTDYWLLITCG